MNTNKILDYGSWVLVAAALVFAGYRMFGQDLTKEVAPIVRAYSVIDDQEVDLPVLDGEPSILLFWATWCGPCKAEMYRLQQSIISGKIKSGRVYAISVGEPIETVLRFAQKSDYAFQFFASPDSRVTEKYKVPGTPTTYHINKDGRIVWAGSGINPISIFKAEELFN